MRTFPKKSEELRGLGRFFFASALLCRIQFVAAVEPLFHASRRLNVRAGSVERDDMLPIV
jgi:hypothetical protein